MLSKATAKNELKVLLTVFGGMTVLAGCSESNSSELTKVQVPPVPAVVSKPVSEEVTLWKEYSGYLQPNKRVQLKARVTGVIEKVLFEDGQIVQEGELLFKIDTRPFKIALTQSESQFEIAKDRFDRANTLFKKGLMSKEDYDLRRVELQIAQASLDNARLDYEYTEIRAPFSGRVSMNGVEVGSVVTGGTGNGTLLTTLTASNPIEFHFNVSGRDNAQLESAALNETAVAHLRLGYETSYKHSGVINFIDAEVDRATGTVQAYASFNNQNRELKPGTYGKIRLNLHPGFRALLIPEKSIGTTQDKKFVYVLSADNTAEMRFIQLGERSDMHPGYRIVKQGLSAQDSIVVSNLMKIRGGAKLAPQAEEKAL